MMIRFALAAVVAALTISSAAQAEDTNFDLSHIADADNRVVETMADIDVDALQSGLTGAEEADAVEACFRRIGYRSRGWSYRGWGCYRPCRIVRYHYCTPVIHHCQPVASWTYSYCAPRVYWGCY